MKAKESSWGAGLVGALWGLLLARELLAHKSATQLGQQSWAQRWWARRLEIQCSAIPSLVMPWVRKWVQWWVISWAPQSWELGWALKSWASWWVLKS